MEKKFIKNNVANAVTASRVVFTVLLLFVSAFSVPFYAFYLLCGFTDMIDGWIARKLHTESENGAMLDSIADLLFAVVYAVKILPFLSIPLWLCIWTAIIAVIKITGIIIASKKTHRLFIVHSLGNKLTGILLFVLPLTNSFPLKVLAAEYIITCLVATFAAVQEGHYIRTGIESE